MIQLTLHISSIYIMDATHYWSFAREFSICNSTVAALQILNSRFQTSHPQQCHKMSLHSFLLQQLSTATTEPARRNIIWLLHGHIK